MIIIPNIVYDLVIIGAGSAVLTATYELLNSGKKTLPNITAIGRSGIFKYNNQDHAMATGLYAAINHLGLGKYNSWKVNIDGEYHEKISTN